MCYKQFITCLYTTYGYHFAVVQILKPKQNIHSLAILLDTPIQSNAIQYNSSAYILCLILRLWWWCCTGLYYTEMCLKYFFPLVFEHRVDVEFNNISGNIRNCCTVLMDSVTAMEKDIFPQQTF